MNTVYLIVGSIGSGKSTISDYLFSTSQLESIEYIGSDVYKKKYFDSICKDGRGYRCADELAFSRMEALCSQGNNFAFELCPTNLNKIRALKAICNIANYNVISFFVGTDDVAINLSRCASREKKGADTVDITKIKKRYFDSMKHILELIRMSKIIYFVDNSTSYPSIVGYIESNQVYILKKNCSWFKTYVISKLLSKIS